MNKYKKPLLFTLALLPLAVAGSYFAARMSVASMAPSVLEPILEQIGSEQTLVLLCAVQPVFLALLSGFLGYLLSERIGLLRPFRFEKAPLCRALLVSLIGGAVFSLDAWTFGKWIPGLGYESTGVFDPVTWIASVLYGGVTEEVMMRLFLMSLLAFLGWKTFRKNEPAVPAKVLIASNVIAALLFAAGHLPATALTFGTLTPLLVFRCFLMNGAFGLVFGRLYRKYGIQYAVLSHILFHVVARTIWLIAF